MATTSKTRAVAAPVNHVSIIQSAERVARLLPTAQYLGLTVLQAPGGWTRVGPTWLVPHLGYVIYGPGTALWGTTRGLAQLAADPDATPSWHAVGLSVAPTVNLCFLITAGARQNPALADVLEIERQVLASVLVGGGANA